MKKNQWIFYLCALVFPSLLYAQTGTGINTKSPKATLDIVAAEGVLSPENGVMIPRVTGDVLASNDALYNIDQDGTMIYVTEAVSNGKVTPKTAEVRSNGLYVYHHSPNRKWMPTIQAKSSITSDKLFVIVNRSVTRLMNANTETVIWDGAVEGQNSNSVELTFSNKIVNLPPNRTLKIQGVVPIGFGGGTDRQKKIASTLSSVFVLEFSSPGTRVHSSSPGFARSSSYTGSNVHEGGATSAFMLIHTGSQGASIRVDVTRQGNLRTHIPGGAAHNTVGSYLIIEEI